MTPKYFCIHGHFYQPPRENPVLGRVEMQPSAWPQHDWNERVYLESYGPNAASRILDEKGRIRDIWNNYAWMSFNAGPTLLAWLQDEHPDTYQRMLEADSLSQERLEGHGNAVAQVYNHCIMPLADERDKKLQIAWGIRDFEQRFGRKPEGMWLAETAIDMDTVVELIRADIRFTILAPTQAWKVRPLGGEIWQDVGESNVDPKQPYRIFPLAEDGTPLEKGFLDVFFYDGPLSSGVGFEHLLKDAQRYISRIQGAFEPDRDEPQFVSICTDGESYGHHEPFGDMCAAYLFKELAPQLDMVPVNYAYWLAKHPPTFEVKLKNAYSGGTAWSCAHGTGRWAYDCGCSTGAPPGWNQRWREPLRQALNEMSGQIVMWLRHQGELVFRDFDAAQLEAPDSWSFDSKKRETFWLRHVDPHASPEQCALAMDLMEAIRFQQYMFTSCGWFFADLTGIETLQVLKYAQRVIALYERHTQDFQVKQEFLHYLEGAVSNINALNGKALFSQLESEVFEPQEYLVLQAWMSRLTGTSFHAANVQGWTIDSHQELNHKGYAFNAVVITQEFSRRKQRCWLAFSDEGLADSAFYFLNPASQADLTAWLKSQADDVSFKDWREVSAHHLPIDVRNQIAQYLRTQYWLDSESDFVSQAVKLRQRSVQYQKLDWPMPKNMQAFLNVIDNHQLVLTLERALANEDLGLLTEACDIAHHLANQNVKVHLGPVKFALHQFMLGLGHRFLDHSTGLELKLLFVLLDLMDTLNLKMEKSRLENLAFPLFQAMGNWAKTGHFPYKAQIEEALALLDRLNFSTDAGKEALSTSKAVEA